MWHNLGVKYTNVCMLSLGYKFYTRSAINLNSAKLICFFFTMIVLNIKAIIHSFKCTVSLQHVVNNSVIFCTASISNSKSTATCVKCISNLDLTLHLWKALYSTTPSTILIAEGALQHQLSVKFTLITCSFITLTFYKTQDSNLFCCKEELLSKPLMLNLCFVISRKRVRRVLENLVLPRATPTSILTCITYAFYF